MQFLPVIGEHEGVSNRPWVRPCKLTRDKTERYISICPYTWEEDNVVRLDGNKVFSFGEMVKDSSCQFLSRDSTVINRPLLPAQLHYTQPRLLLSGNVHGSRYMTVPSHAHTPH